MYKHLLYCSSDSFDRLHQLSKKKRKEKEKPPLIIKIFLELTNYLSSCSQLGFPHLNILNSG